jgi:hypothetical protein
VTLTYDNGFSPTNVYGHALFLLERLCLPDESVHIDIGCGFGRMAEPLVQRLRRHYVGLDVDVDGLASLTSRGFETHQLTLGAREDNVAAITAILRGRRLGSITMLDTLEHLYDPLGALLAIRKLIGVHNVPAVISVPNVTHRDLGIKLLVGRFDYTEAGLLDSTHVGFFTEARLIGLARHAGLHQLGARDVYLECSDQRFPGNHLALAEGALLHRFLRHVRDAVDSLGSVNQFVRAFAAGEAHTSPDYASRELLPAPFLSVVIRTQGRRLDGLRDVFTALMGQTSADFEVLVLGHRLELEQQLLVERVIADNPTSLRDRIRLIKVDHGNRTAPLNFGFAEAQGCYVSILDDDDLVFGHWVETFESLASVSPGAILRAGCVRQYNEVVDLFDHSAARAISGFDCIYPSEFDWAAHISDNRSPGLSLAFPRSAFVDLGLRFDEVLTTAEDWDFLLRALPLCGLTNSPEITSIYRWWTNRPASQKVHVKSEWDANREWIRHKLTFQPYLLPAGSTRRIRELFEQNANLLNENADLHLQNQQLRLSLGAAAPHSTSSAAIPVDPMKAILLRAHLGAIYASNSWRYTRLVRIIATIFGRPLAVEKELDRLDASELKSEIEVIRRSTSWRITGPLRVVARLARARRH